MRLYIAVLDEFPDYMTPTLVAHTMLGAHMKFTSSYDGDMLATYPEYFDWLHTSFRKCVVRVNQKEFDKIVASCPDIYLGHENSTLGGRKACAIPLPCPDDELPKVLKFAKLWKPRGSNDQAIL